MKKLIIFDLDGTLFDTTEAMKACGNDALKKMGLPPLEGWQYARCSGTGVEKFADSVLLAAGDTEHRDRDTFWRYYLGKNEALQKGLNVPYKEIPQLLFELKERGLHLAVLSNKDESSCIPIVKEAFGERVFDQIRGERKGFPPKPDPASAFEIMKDFSVKPEECLYVGDTEVDMLTGKNAGIDTIAVLWGYREREVLEAFSPAFLASSPLEILSFLGEEGFDSI